MTSELQKLKTHIVTTELSFFVKKATLIDEITAKSPAIARLIEEFTSMINPEIAIT